MTSILLCDDSEELRVGFKHALSKLGYTVCEASNGREGISAFEKASQNGGIDVIATDINMPSFPGDQNEFTGIDMALHLMQKYGFPSSKVIYMSGDHDYYKLIPPWGIWLPKPVRLQSLREKIEEAKKII